MHRPIRSLAAVALAGVMAQMDRADNRHRYEEFSGAFKEGRHGGSTKVGAYEKRVAKRRAKKGYSY